MDAWNDLIVQVVSHLLEQAGTRMYDVYYLPRQPPPSTGVLLGLCDIIPPPILLFILCWGGVSILRRIVALVMWLLQQFWRLPEYIVTPPIVSIPQTPAPTPHTYLPLHPSPPQLTEFARLVAPYLADNQLTALHQPTRMSLMSATPAHPSVTPHIGCPPHQPHPTPIPPTETPGSPREQRCSSPRRTRSSSTRR